MDSHSSAQASRRSSHAAANNGATAKHEFQAVAPTRHIERQQRLREKKHELGIALSEIFLGIAIERKSDSKVDIGFACHDGTYSIDFAGHTLRTDGTDSHGDRAACPTKLPEDYEATNSYTFVGVGLSQEVLDISPQIAPRLWLELDIVPLLIKVEEGGSLHTASQIDGVDELADSMARKCLMFFGPSFQPRVQVGFSNKVEVDLANRARLTSIEDYKRTVSERTWSAVTKYAAALKERKVKIAFFSATPQGGWVALMRHALIRFYTLLGVDCTWWVPKPKPEIFRITKTNHNILQAVAGDDERLSDEQASAIHDWVQMNADRFWLRDKGPLQPRSEGGADVIIVDDPQMPNIVDISKKADPEHPVIFRSHIQIQADLADTPGTPTAGVWDWLWQSVKHADLFIAHPVSAFVPKHVNRRALAYMPATTDWLDGLNKEIRDFGNEYYLHEFNTECVRQRMNTLQYPKRDYIVQIARFDPSKGIPDVLASYAELRRNSEHCRDKKADETPQLVVADHYSVDDPDGVRVLNQTLELLDGEYSDIKDSVVVMRLGPTDQLLNVLMQNARVALQLSTREGFEVKVSEGLHKGVPVIVTKAGGIPLQVQPEKSGFLVETGDYKAVAKYLDVLFSDEERYQEMSQFAASHVSDEVGTVGNAVNWMYLADQLSRGERVEPGGRWIWDLVRDLVGEGREEGEVRLPRNWTT
ncbi:Trehalose phosphorylase [Fulvia fulva]|nr:Trehalose phosphorylase [Fulvia fulva]KAK4616827.1 Trehalose phosphorylase [Fulvia fulva]WPV19312.1 Trehalose phosphorylase [Fulvia fulva]WPV34599.1 Trehalose phosphorylase [Fulvia fulva]